MISGVIWLTAEAAIMSGTPLAQAIKADTIGLVLGKTEFGRLWVLRFFLAMALCTLLLSIGRSATEQRRLRIAVGAVLVAAAYLATLAWAGHAAAGQGSGRYVQIVSDVDTAPVTTKGPLIENHPRFPSRVNAGFMQVVSRSRVRLRVWERGVGETLACGTGACAAVVAGIRAGRLDAKVDVETRGGVLTIQWAGEGPDGMAPVLMTGPAVTVFEGEIEVPDQTV